MPIDKLPSAKSRAILTAALTQAGGDIAKLHFAFDGQKNVFTVNDTSIGGTSHPPTHLFIHPPTSIKGEEGKRKEAAFSSLIPTHPPTHL